MGSWSALFVALASPVAKRVLLSLGIGFVTMAGLSAVQSQIASAVAAGWSGMPASAYQIVAMAGLINAANVWLSAITVVVSSLAISRLGVLTS